MGPWALTNELGSLEFLRNSFQNTYKNRKFSNSTESNIVALFHIIKAWKNRLFRLFNRLFRLFNRLFFKNTWKRLWNYSILTVWIKTQSNFAKNTFLRCKNSLKVWLAFWKFIHNFHKIVNLPLKRFTIFTKTWVTIASRVFSKSIPDFQNHFSNYSTLLPMLWLYFSANYSCLSSGCSKGLA